MLWWERRWFSCESHPHLLPLFPTADECDVIPSATFGLSNSFGVFQAFYKNVSIRRIDVSNSC